MTDPTPAEQPGPTTDDDWMGDSWIWVPGDLDNDQDGR